MSVRLNLGNTSRTGNGAVTGAGGISVLGHAALARVALVLLVLALLWLAVAWAVAIP